MRAQVTSTGARKLRTLSRQTDAAIGVPPRSPPNQTDDTRKVRQGCQTCARKGPVRDYFDERHRCAAAGGTEIWTDAGTAIEPVVERLLRWSRWSTVRHEPAAETLRDLTRRGFGDLG
jgi:hypothetical protein